MSGEDLASSLMMRDIIRRLVKEAINKYRPRYRYGIVQTIAQDRKSCTIVYNGETNEVKVKLGSVQPLTTGQSVRVEGIGIDKFVADVVGQPYSWNKYGTVAADYTSGPVSVLWEGDTVASGPYHLVRSTDTFAAGNPVVGIAIPGHDYLIVKVASL